MTRVKAALAALLLMITLPLCVPSATGAAPPRPCAAICDTPREDCIRVPLELTCAGGIEIEGSLSVAAHQMVRLRIANRPEGAAVIWDVTPEEAVDAEELPDGRLLFTAPPGKYKVKARAIVTKDGRTEVLACRKDVVIGLPPVPPPAPEKPPEKPPEAPKPDRKADPVAATAYLTMGRTGCTATPIWPRRPDGRWDVVSAAHCVTGVGAKGRIKLRDGRTFNVTVAALDRTADISWLITDEKPDDMPFARLAASLPDTGVDIWHNGYGVDKPSNVEHGTVTGVTSDGQLSFLLNVSSGDSGGGIFRKDTGELVATVCCTRTIARKTTMYGGHCVRAQALRPK